MNKYGAWEAAYHCKGCGEEMDNDARLHSGGICPLCGNASVGSVVKCDKRIRRKVYKPRIGRREAIEATRARSNSFSFFCYRVVTFFRRARPQLAREFTWEYKEAICMSN